jgi:subfamily B ATP-binding cassette protein MsbA
LILGGIIILLVGGLGVIRGTETLGTLVSFYAATVLLASNMRLVTSSIPAMDEGWDSLRVLAPLLDGIKTAPENKTEFRGLKRAVVFENVSFSFSEQKFKLENINAAFGKNRITGIFGPSGSGKSTILNLLLGLYPPAAGRITVDGADLADLDLAGYRKRIGVLSQDPGFFFGTIRENLAYGLNNLDENELIRICSLVRINDFVKNLNRGFETMLGDRGVSISGGQRQRLAIARALLRKPDILILDEPDNNLDEDIIGEILSELKKENLTIIVVSHNKRLRPLMDSALVIRGGAVTEEK